MKSILVFLLFVAMFLIMHGIYEQRLKELEKNKKIEYRFVPRTLYEEQLSDSDLSQKVGGMFEAKVVPWSKSLGQKINS